MTIEDLLKIQKKAKRVYIIGSIITIIVALIVAFFTYFFSGAIIVLMFGIIIISIVNNKNKKEFQKGFKELFVLKALQSVFTDLVYKPEEGLDKRIISSTQMMDMGDVYDSNDYISGKYKNINIVQADVHIKEEREDSEGHTSYVTIFEGKWMIFDFNKYFMANVQVCQKGFYNNEVNQLFSKTKYKKVKMEDINFNNNFKVYAQDEHDAFYILTPSFMERLIKLTNSIKGKMLFCRKSCEKIRQVYGCGNDGCILQYRL